MIAFDHFTLAVWLAARAPCPIARARGKLAALPFEQASEQKRKDIELIDLAQREAEAYGKTVPPAWGGGPMNRVADSLEL